MRIALCTVLLVALVAAGSAAEARDVHEPDDTPQSARVLNDDGSLGPWVQDHDFDPGSDEDWVALIRLRPELTFEIYEVSVNDLSILGLPLKINLQLYDQTLLRNPSTPPLDEYNNCSAAPSDGGPQNVSIMLQGSQIGLLRVRNCDALAGNYQIVITNQPGGVEDNPALVIGQTLVDGQPPLLPVLLITSNNDATFSNPTSGEYTMTVLAESPATINVVSNLFSADPVALPAVAEGQTVMIDVSLRSLDWVFRDGFER